MPEYIDRDQAIETVKFYDGDPDGIPWAIRSLKVVPAADVKPVVRGRWKQTGGKYSRDKTIDRRILTCSVCGNVLGMEAVNCGRGDANFCPNCGADLRGVADDGGE